jgi:hypothetical protein
MSYIAMRAHQAVISRLGMQFLQRDAAKAINTRRERSPSLGPGNTSGISHSMATFLRISFFDLPKTACYVDIERRTQTATRTFYVPSLNIVILRAGQKGADG